jgi:dTDP-4-amino-4,6-dideoxy-D-galactose acyltransferase
MKLCPLTSRPDEARTLIRDSVPWSPLDFVRGISVDGDRAVHAASLLRNIDPADDLRFSYPITADTEVAVCAERLPWDSAFFGYGVARLHGIFPLRKNGYRFGADYTAAIDTLTELARSREVRYLFAVVDSRDLPTSRALTARGFSLLETRVYFHRPVHNYDYSRRFRCRLATAADLTCLTALARTVENPFDRFNADPFIDRAEVVRLMETWIRASLVEGFADATWIPDTHSPGAVITMKYHHDKSDAWNMSIAQLVLGMASSPRAGNGFVGLFSEANYHLKGIGMDHVIFSTQITNRSVIRVGEHLGFKHGKGEYVFRLLL